MLALARRRLRHVRLGFTGAAVDDGEAVSNRAMLPQAESVSAAHKSAGAAKRRRRHSLTPLFTLNHVRTRNSVEPS